MHVLHVATCTVQLSSYSACRLTSSGATGRTSVLSKTSISSPSALAATAGEELTGASRVPPAILGLLFFIHLQESSDSALKGDSTCWSLRSHLAFGKAGASATTEGEEDEHHARLRILSGRIFLGRAGKRCRVLELVRAHVPAAQTAPVRSPGCGAKS